MLDSTNEVRWILTSPVFGERLLCNRRWEIPDSPTYTEACLAQELGYAENRHQRVQGVAKGPEAMLLAMVLTVAPLHRLALQGRLHHLSKRGQDCQYGHSEAPSSRGAAEGTRWRGRRRGGTAVPDRDPAGVEQHAEVLPLHSRHEGWELLRGSYQWQMVSVLLGQMYFDQAEEYAPHLGLKLAQKRTSAGPVAMVWLRNSRASLIVAGRVPVFSN
jgi:hypothetical protein